MHDVTNRLYPLQFSSNQLCTAHLFFQIPFVEQENILHRLDEHPNFNLYIDFAAHENFSDRLQGNAQGFVHILRFGHHCVQLSRNHTEHEFKRGCSYPICLRFFIRPQNCGAF